MFVRGNTVSGETFCAIYLMSGGLTSNSGGTCHDAGVVSGELLVIIKKGENVICSFDDVTNSGTF